MKVFLLDDEKNARESVKAYLLKSGQGSFDTIEAASVSEGLEVLGKNQVDLAFLDVDLGDGTSFDLLGQLPNLDFKIIFISAFNEYAVKAFKFNAIDYILKPINPLEFNAALEKAIHLSPPVSSDQFEKLSDDLDTEVINKLIVKDFNAIHFLEIDEIILLKSDNNYTVFNLEGSKEEIVISKNLGEYEDILSGRSFFRAHRSFLINLKHIKKYDKREGGYIEMKNGQQVPLSRNKRAIFLQLLERRVK